MGSRSIIILGCDGVVGRFLLELLAEDHRVKNVVAIDAQAPPNLPAKAKGLGMDLHSDEAIDQLAAVIDREDIDTVCYLGYLSDRKNVQEKQVDEVERVVKVLQRRSLPKVIFASSTTVYGALPGDPTHLDETTPLAVDAQSGWVRDKVKSEQVIQEYMLEAEGTVTTLRFGIPLGPTVHNFMTDYLYRKAVPVVMGQDPPVQFIHERDVAAALHHAISNDHDGPYNIVGYGALPLTVALRIGRRRSAPVPELGSYPLHHALWDPDILDAPVVLQDLFRYVWVADGTRANRVMKFTPERSTKETCEDFYKNRV